VWEEVVLFLLSSVKFFLAPPTGIAFGFSFFKTVTITTTGGISGVIFFYYFGRWVNRMIKRLIRKFKKKKKEEECPKKFTFQNKLIVKLKMFFGVNGLAIASPILISIPIGSILASRYFHKNTTPIVFCVWVLVWSLALTGLSAIFRDFFTSLID
jgi:membrane protein YqaA with SNARE-associated domain